MNCVRAHQDRAPDCAFLEQRTTAEPDDALRADQSLRRLDRVFQFVRSVMQQSECAGKFVQMRRAGKSRLKPDRRGGECVPPRKIA